MKQVILVVAGLSMLASGSGRADDAPRCCFTMAAYVNNTKAEMPCNDPLGHVWFCPRARAHMPEQNFCDPAAQYAITSKRCLVRRPNAQIPMLWVMCGPSFGQCLDGPASGETVDAFNDLCGGRCTDRNAGAGACSNESANTSEATLVTARIAKRQNEELEGALLAAAHELEEAEAALRKAEEQQQ